MWARNASRHVPVHVIIILELAMAYRRFETVMRPNLAVFVRIPRYTFASSERPLGDNPSVLIRAKAFAANRPARDMRVQVRLRPSRGSGIGSGIEGYDAVFAPTHPDRSRYR